jgi:hypothetical protein
MDDEDAKFNAMMIGKKVGFEVLARCLHNDGIGALAVALIDLLKSSEDLQKRFMTTMLEDDEAEVFCKILFECPDKQAQTALAQVIKYLIVSLKVIERDEIEEYNNDDPWDKESTPLSIQFLDILLSFRHTRAARAWPRFQSYLELLLSFGVQSPEQCERWSI